MATETVLGRRGLYMLPTQAGGAFGVLLLILLVAAVNYGNGLVYGLTFLLAAAAVVSMLHTHRNVSGVRLSAGPSASVFAGEHAAFSVCLTNESPRARFGLSIRAESQELASLDLEPGETRCVTVNVETRERGYHLMPPVVLVCEFPFGIFYTWSRSLAFGNRCLVYPAPAELGEAAHLASGVDGEGIGQARHGDDFAGQREYRLGDSLRHVNWKAAARGQTWFTKEYGGGGSRLTWLDWDLLAPLDDEARLSVLCRQVLDAEQAGFNFGLRVPGQVIEPGTGEAHRVRCLEALALFPAVAA